MFWLPHVRAAMRDGGGFTMRIIWLFSGWCVTVQVSALVLSS